MRKQHERYYINKNTLKAGLHVIIQKNQRHADMITDSNTQQHSQDSEGFGRREHEFEVSLDSAESEFQASVGYRKALAQELKSICCTYYRPEFCSQQPQQATQQNHLLSPARRNQGL